jgi:uncharacterized protein (TIGR03086 family)
MDDLRALHRRAADEFGRRVEKIEPDQWSGPTPCDDWDVRTLVNHLVYENRWVPDLMAGKTVAEVGDRFDGDLLGDDPKGAWRDSVAQAVAVFAAEGALDRTVHLSFGDVPGGEYASELTSDLTVHAWDLAVAIGDDASLDPALVSFTFRLWRGREQLLRNSGLFADPVEVAADADEQTRLLALLGRRSSWTP